MGRIKQIRMVAGIVRKANPKALPIVIGTGIGIIAIVVVIGGAHSACASSSRLACCSGSPRR